MKRPASLPGARLASRAALAIPALLLAACDAGGPDASAELRPPPGSLLAPAAEHRQARAPVAALGTHLDGFHFRNGDLASQQRSQHYCGAVGEEVVQCALFDGTGPGARMTGVKYVISERLFEGLPEDEKAYWHSQVHPVKAGTLVAPGLPEDAEHALASKLVRTYAKTWQLWPGQGDRQAALPVGVPQLMMGFTKEGQLDPVLLAERDRSIGVASAEKRRRRADIPEAPPAAGADAWQQGRIAQVQGAVDERRRP
ncbi:MAG TPA: DUF1264 domain-containing protein [Burkholderiaceae bacterium]|nr:DUF1264 domain-containing protein [Burkholderiaceae bacterium]